MTSHFADRIVLHGRVEMRVLYVFGGYVFQQHVISSPFDFNQMLVGYDVVSCRSDRVLHGRSGFIITNDEHDVE